MADTPTTPDAAQTFFTLPQEILDAFRNLGNIAGRVQSFDYAGAALVVLGLFLLLLGAGMVAWEETVQRPGREGVREVAQVVKEMKLAPSSEKAPLASAQPSERSARKRATRAESKQTVSGARRFLASRKRGE